MQNLYHDGGFSNMGMSPALLENAWKTKRGESPQQYPVCVRTAALSVRPSVY
jgi:hypothetical protein